MSDLTIYKASAGSGKTFQLTSEYLTLIFNRETSFKSVLAVTFTNKATGEMRDRILKELYLLSEGKKSDHAENLKKLYKLTDNDLKIRAKYLLKDILHNYGRFNISTIDSFFQTILKSFTREIGLNVGFTLELDKRQILELSIENFFEKINEKDELKNWLSDFAIQKIEDGKGWDIQHDILKFSNDAFGELFFSFTEEQLEEFSNIENLKKYKSELNKIVKSFQESLKSIGRRTQGVLSNNNLSVDDFSYKNSGVVGFLLKQKDIKTTDIDRPGKRALTALHTEDFISGWCAKKSEKKDIIQGVVQNNLHPFLKETFHLFEQSFEHFITAFLIQKSINVLAVIVEVFGFLIDYCNEKNIFLLPLASPLLAKMIGSDDAPFIYEKTGEYLRHFMIDEFQDTSNLQWTNFSPLFFNSVAQGYKSLVVGDVKQSIYRWRNSDWTLLENKIQKQFKAFGFDEITLPYNWRSEKNVIDFNNVCFVFLSKIVQNQINLEFEELGYNENINLIERIFSNGAQKVPEKAKDTNGFVNINFYDFGNNTDINELLVTNYVIDSLNALFDKGFLPKDIAILVRRNKEGAIVAKSLMEYKRKNPERSHLFDFVSNDSVFLGSSGYVQLIISLLEYIIDPSDILSRGKILQFYYTLNSNSEAAAQKLIELNINNVDEFNAELPIEFVAQFKSLKEQSLIQLVNALLKIFIYNKGYDLKNQLPFLQSFQDCVLNYTKNKGSDILGFIDWWNEYGVETPVSLSEDQNAIRILTIHKSKGLEYKAVIVPFTNWNLDQLPTLLWCKPKSLPFNTLSLVPVQYSSKLSNSIFKEEYLIEKLMAVIDSLNLLYVAFTRAEQALFIGAPLQKKDSCRTVGDLINMLHKNIENENLVAEKEWDEHAQTFSYGKLEENKTTEPGDFTYKWNDIPTLSSDLNRIKLRHSSDVFISDHRPNLHKGKVFHKILEGIKTMDDLPNSVSNLINIGLISEKEGAEYQNTLYNSLSNPEIESWFTNDWKVLNEVSIIDSDGNLKRPDRVIMSENEIIVIDYKHTINASESHVKQVWEYIELIRKIENKKISGFVWYLLTDQLVRVE